MTYKQVKTAIICLDSSGKVLSTVGQSALLPEGQNILEKAFTILHPELKALGLKGLKSVHSLELSPLIKDGPLFQVLMVKDKDNLQLVITDMILASEDEKVSTLDLEGIGTFTYDMGSKALSMNRKLQNYLGISDGYEEKGIDVFDGILSAKDFKSIVERGKSLHQADSFILPHVLINTQHVSMYMEIFIERKGNVLVGICQDVTEGFMSEESFQQAFQNSSIGMALVKPDGAWYKVNSALTNILGYSREELLNTDFQSITYKDDLDKDLDLLQQVLDGKIKKYQMEKRYYRKNGELIWALLSVSLIRDKKDNPVYFISQIQDINSQKEYEQSLEKIVHVDHLTDLPNRGMIIKLLNELSDEKGFRKTLSFVMIDLDGFRRINELYGNDIGDRVIKESAQRLKQLVSSKDVVARFGGDEFVLLLVQDENEETESEDIGIFMNRATKAFDAPFLIEDYEFYITFSAGVAIYPQTSDAVSDLIAHAEVALDKVKSIGGGQYTTYTKSIRDEQNLRRQIEFYLEEAVENGEIEAYFQPQYSIENNDCVGFEALARWKCANLPNITPDKFIEIAEECRFVHKIDLCVMEKGLKKLQEHVHMGAFTTLSVNLSALTLSYRGIVELINELVDKYQFPHEQIILEVTETRLLEDIERAKKTLQAFSNLGYKIAVDDFGTGYSSLQYLRDFTVDQIKIDRSFIQRIDQNQTRMVVKAAIEMGQAIGARVIAEGVETTKQHETLMELGCDEIQGYLYGEPDPDPFKYLD